MSAVKELTAEQQHAVDMAYRDLYHKEVEAFQEFYEWAMTEIRNLYECGPEVLEYKRQQWRIDTRRNERMIGVKRK